MNYLNIHTDTLKSEEFIGAEPVERATWIALLGWCASQENGGVIEGCSEWGDRKWMSLCGVTSDEVKTISKLYGFRDGNLVVTFYPVESEASVKAKRSAGKKGGRPAMKKSGKPPSLKEKKPHGSGNGNHMVKQMETISETKRKGRKGKEKKGNEKNTPHGVSEGEGEPTPSNIPSAEEARSFATSSGSMISADCVEAWRDSRIASGWTRPQGGNSVPIMDWRADLRGFARSWRSNRQNAPEAPKPPPKPTKGPSGWREAFRELIPNGPVPLQWTHVDLPLRAEIIETIGKASV